MAAQSRLQLGVAVRTEPPWRFLRAKNRHISAGVCAGLDEKEDCQVEPHNGRDARVDRQQYSRAGWGMSKGK
jgi:hypothetical protein